MNTKEQVSTPVSTPLTPVAPSRAARRRKPKMRRPPRPPEKSTAPLKAATVQERLKAERIQEELRSIPAWKLADSQRSIDRVREFSDGQEAAAYMSLVAGLAGLRGQPVDISYTGGRVVVTLSSLLTRGRRGLTQNTLEFARLLG